MDSTLVNPSNSWNHFPNYFNLNSDIAINPQQYVPLRDVLEWPPALVRNWLVGLGPEFHSISSEFQTQQVRGNDLLHIGVERLLTLGISSISQQETILQALEQLRNVTCSNGESTLLISQSLSVHLTQLIQHLCTGIVTLFYFTAAKFSLSRLHSCNSTML